MELPFSFNNIPIEGPEEEILLSPVFLKRRSCKVRSISLVNRYNSNRKNTATLEKCYCLDNKEGLRKMIASLIVYKIINEKL